MMTRYCLPRNAKELTAIALVEHEQGVQGMVAPLPTPSVAAVALAGWLLSDLRRTMRCSHSPSSVLSMGSTISRLLAGSVAPTDQLAEALARLSDGAVAPADWGRAFTVKAEAAHTADYDPGRVSACGEVALNASPQPPASSADRVEQAAGSALDLIYATDPASFAVLGETPPGPLFGVLAPSRLCPFYEVHGLGLSFRLNESQALALHASLAKAIDARQIAA